MFLEAPTSHDPMDHAGCWQGSELGFVGVAARATGNYAA